MDIKFDELDPGFKYEVAKRPGGDKIKYCYSCGTCTASCPVRKIDERFNPRQIIRMALLGMKEKVYKSEFIWLCTACYSCQEKCPQDVKITDLMTVFKNLATEAGYVHPSYLQIGDFIKSSGRVYVLEDFDNKKREKAGLPALPLKIDEVEKVFEITGFSKLIPAKQEAAPEEVKTGDTQ
ncbi:MAG: 4Fe-4S dicluster domain-containing protein [Candidatus Schekmanbacteria bacterium]|nr:4Fe-4S dicluster domain-containing protein [Candidatus Schekmanbacteria bacterium]